MRVFLSRKHTPGFTSQGRQFGSRAVDASNLTHPNDNEREEPTGQDGKEQAKNDEHEPCTEPSTEAAA